MLVDQCNNADNVRLTPSPLSSMGDPLRSKIDSHSGIEKVHSQTESNFLEVEIAKQECNLPIASWPAWMSVMKHQSAHGYHGNKI